MLQKVKTWAYRAMHKRQTEVNTHSSTLGEELDDVNDWRTGQYGWVTKGGRPGPYLKYVRGLTALSEHHHLLADFMDAGTMPSRWNPDEPGGYPENIVIRDRAKAERMRRTHVCLLEYPRDNTEVQSRIMRNSQDLESVLSNLQVDTSIKLRLFIAEDLSRDVIEALGHHLKIDPSFFHDHIIDSQWDHLDDGYRAPPRLRTSIPKQSWYTLRYVRARNFRSNGDLDEAVKTAENFNVHRRLKYECTEDNFWERDRNRKNLVGLIQSKATMWVRRPAEANDDNLNAKNAQNTSTAVLLLDPSFSEGNPLWYKTRNWTQTPKMGSHLPKDSKEVPDNNSFENFVYWAKKPEIFPSLSTASALSPTLIPTQILLQIICNEWRTLLDYIQTRLNQIDWDLAFPDDFLELDTQWAMAHNRVVRWRQMLPVFRDMIQNMGCLEHTVHDILSDESIWVSERNIAAESEGDFQKSHHHIHKWKNPYQLDISRIGDRMAEFDDHIDRLVEAIQIVRSMDCSRDRPPIRYTTTLSYVAFFWILGPFLASLCAMTTRPMSELVPSLRLWAITAFPFMLVLLVGLRIYMA